MVQPWAANLQPTRRRAPGKAADLPGFDAGRRIGGAAPYGPPQALDPPCAPCTSIPSYSHGFFSRTLTAMARGVAEASVVPGATCCVVAAGF